jgi:DNA-binding IclR family transcriptional regulator
MLMTEAPAAHVAAPPEAQIAQILPSQLASRLTHLFAIQLADHLSDGPKTAEDLALVTDTHAPTLYRILRTMASLGFVTESADHRFALQPLGAALKSGTPSHAAALAIGGELLTRSSFRMTRVVPTGLARERRRSHAAVNASRRQF